MSDPIRCPECNALRLKPEPDATCRNCGRSLAAMPCSSFQVVRRNPGHWDIYSRDSRHFLPQRLLDCLAGQRESIGEEMHGDSLRSSRPDREVPRLQSGLVGLVGSVRL